jgi:DNA polymerase-1
LKEVVPKGTKHGTISLSSIPRSLRDRVADLSIDAPFSCFEWEEFNPGSVKQIVERLNEAGWEPTEKTKTGKSFKISERNLASLPESAPRAARKLVQRLFLASRCRRLDEWLSAVRDGPEGSRIHGRFNHIGCWTHRMSHTNPNMANVPSEKSVKYGSEEMREMAASLSKEMRELWIASPGKVLVGCDAEGIQLRIFAHYVNDPEFTTALVSGNTEDGTDAHSLNAKVLGPGVQRSQAKTFIYAFLLGVGLAKTSQIFNCSVGEAKDRVERFVRRYPGLQRIREDLIPRDVARGYFDGFDQRKVMIDEAKRTGNVLGNVLGAYLQNGEACIMKHANILWRKELNDKGIWFRQVNFVHDEWQTETKEAEAEMVGRVQSASIASIGHYFELNCPMAGSFKIGRNWFETH